MLCDRIEELLSAYLERELGIQDHKTVEDHLKTCPDCRSLLVYMQETRKALADFPELEVSENLQSRLYAIPEAKKRFRFKLDFFMRPSIQPILAAATILLTLFSFYAFNPNRDQINKSINRQLHLGISKVERLYARAESFTNQLTGYKDELLVSMKNINILKKDDE